MKKAGRKKGSIPWNKGKTRDDDPRIAQHWLGKERSAETVEKIRETKNTACYKHTEEAKAKISKAMSGRALSKKTCEKIAVAMSQLGRPDHLKGANNKRWNGRNRRTIRRIALERDSFKCRICQDVATEADHIIPIKIRPDLLADFSNIQSLCKKCHRKKTNADIKYIKSLRSNDSESDVQPRDCTS